MHRSGTSAITRAMQVLDVDLGNHLMTANPDVNAKGFWEDVDLTALNDEMLHAVGQNWHTLAPFEPSHVARLCEVGYLTKAVGLLSKKIESIRVFGFKDPRVARLLPFWRRVLSNAAWTKFTYSLSAILSVWPDPWLSGMVLMQ